MAQAAGDCYNGSSRDSPQKSPRAAEIYRALAPHPCRYMFFCGFVMSLCGASPEMPVRCRGNARLPPIAATACGAT